MIHVINTEQSTNLSKLQVHLAFSLNSDRTFCGRAHLYRDDPIDGRVLRYHETKRPLNCRNCVTSLVMVARDETNKLDGTQLEAVLDYMMELRKDANGHAHGEQPDSPANDNGTGE